MTAEDFLEQFQDILQRDTPINLDTCLCDIEEWDSLTAMTLIAFFEHKLGLHITFDNFKDCRTIQDIWMLSAKP